MKHYSNWFVAAAVCALSACSGTTSPATHPSSTTTDPSATPGSSSAPTPQPPDVQVAQPKTFERLVDYLPSQAQFVLRVDFQKLQREGLFPHIRAALRETSESEVVRNIELVPVVCDFDPIKSLEEVMVAPMLGGLVVAARMSVPARSLETCLRNNMVAAYLKKSGTKITRLEIAGNPAIKISDRGFVVMRDKFLVMSKDRALLEQTLTEKTGPSVGKLPTPGSAVGNGFGAIPSVFENGRLTLSNTSSESRIEFDLTWLQTEPKDQAFVGKVRTMTGLGLRTKVLDSAIKQLGQNQAELLGLVDAASYSSNGTSRKLLVTLSGDDERRGKQLVLLASAFAEGQELYDPVAVAKSNVWAIGKRIAAFANGELQPGVSGKLPASAPAVPSNQAQVKGRAYAASPRDFQHPSWKSIGFSLTGPQRYQYEFETSPDGQSATARGRGDLNGDGSYSTLSVTVRMVDGKAVLDSYLTLQKPYE